MYKFLEGEPMTEHTPTPWEVSDQPAMRKGVIWFHRIYCRGTLAPARGRGSTPEEAKANAEFIVLACNAHAPLVAACEEHIEAVDGITSGIADRKAHATLCIRAALDLAKEE